MLGLGTGLGIGVLTLTFTSVSLAGAGQTGQTPGKVKQALASPFSKNAKMFKGKHRPAVLTPPPPSWEQRAQLPSDQAQTRAWLQDAARQEPAPDERTLQIELRESQRLQQERERNEPRQRTPQTLNVTHAGGNRSVADGSPTKTPEVALGIPK